jgi:hypothetical protein
MIDGKETVILTRGYEGQFLTDPAESFARLGRNPRGFVIIRKSPLRGEGRASEKAKRDVAI